MSVSAEPLLEFGHPWVLADEVGEPAERLHERVVQADGSHVRGSRRKPQRRRQRLFGQPMFPAAEGRRQGDSPSRGKAYQANQRNKVK